VPHSVELLLPAFRYVFALDNEGNAELQPATTNDEGFRSYKKVQAEGRPVGMIAVPNCVLVRAQSDYVVDPGVIMQGAPISGALRAREIEPHECKVLLTHTHFDHVQALIEFAMRDTYVHRIELEAPYTSIEQNKLDMVQIKQIDGEHGEIEPGLRWILTPGHSPGLVSFCVDTDDGLVVIASDCVGPLPEYFDEMTLPEDFGPERELLLEQWQRIRDLDPYMVIPGHYPPVVLK
jgi:glyoxylase-like metal-dependent hydrolase (beta-lactamase superfamily II)